MKNNTVKFVERLLLVFCTVVLVFSCFGTHAFAAENTVFVAGNPNLYPIEYYNSSTKQYQGLMPDIYALLSQKTGYQFRYINASSNNGQQRMAKNGQAELISAYVAGEIDAKYLKNAKKICRVEIQGVEKDVYIAFSEIASKQLVAAISAALDEISADQKLLLVSSHTAQNGNNGIYVMWIYILAGVVLAFIIAGMILMIHTVKKRRQSRKNDMIDPKYGIGNDKYYIYCFDHLITEKSKSLYYLAYIAFDEKEFNKQYGTVESQSVQHYTAEFLNNKTGAVEYLSRIGEGVFAFLYQGANKTEAEKRMSSIIAELDTHLAGFSSEYSGLFRAGVCVLEENMDCNSEAAFYHAKQGYLYALRNKEKFSFSTKRIVEDSLKNERLHKRLMQAIDNGEFKMHLQFIVDRNGKIFGAEAISRWNHPQEGLLSPAKYIEMMNQSDVVTLHDLCIFTQVCRQLETWKKSGYEHLYLSCNFTRYSITGADFAERLKEIFEKFSFNPGNLIIEITENSLSYNTASFKQNIEKCKEIGFLIAIDDIGSGYTSLSDLYQYPIDFVKVERDIVLNAESKRGQMLLNGLIRLVHSMNIRVLCEGVETKQQNSTVLDAGCDYIQGFYYSHVLPQKEAERFLKSYENG